MFRNFRNIQCVSMSFKVVRLALLFAAIFLVVTASEGLALTADQSQLVQLADSLINGSSSYDSSIVKGMAIDGTYALVDWTDKSNSGGELLASKASGSWTTVVNGGGQANATDLVSKGVDSASANFLVSNLRPLPPIGGPSQSYSGSATYQTMVEKCSTGNDHGPKWYYPHVVTPDTRTQYSAAVTPSSPGSAIVLDVTATAGTVQVTLLGPLGEFLKQAVVPPGLTGGAGYFSPDAGSGSYQFLVTGTQRGNGLDCGGQIMSGPSILTDATWSAILSW